MFLSLPKYEFSFPTDLTPPGSKHWTMVELTLQMPWFLLSIELVDAENPQITMIRTICIASTHDLAALLPSLEASSVTGIVCMMPAWQSANAQWSSREVREVWMCNSDAGQSVLLCDAAGQEFDCGLAPEHVEPMKKELVLRVPPAKPLSRARSERKPRAGSRRV